MSLAAKLIVELVGTFIFLSVILATNGQAIATGLALAAMIFFGGQISGGNYNPAITFMSYMQGSTSVMQCGTYVIAQLIGALCALYFFRWAH